MTLSSNVLASGPGATPAAFRDPGEVRRAVIASHHDLARRLGERGAYEEAEEHFAKALAMTRRLGDGASLEEAALLDDLAEVLGDMGEPAAAEALFRRALEIRRELLGEEHPQVAQVRYSLGNLLHDQGNLDDAERLYRQAADLMARTLSADHPARAYPQVAMGRLLLDRGEGVAAEGLLREALSRLAATHAPGHWRIADAESLLGGSLAAQGRYEEAEALMRPAYVALQEQLSARSPRTRRALARLADLYRSREQSLHAEQFLDGHRPALDRLDPEVVTIDQAHAHEGFRLRTRDVNGHRLFIPDQDCFKQIEDLDRPITDQGSSLPEVIQVESLDDR